MGAPAGPDQWDERLRAYAQQRPSRSLQLGVRFLAKSRSPGSGWGPLPGVPSEPYYTALAVEALQCSAVDGCADLAMDALLAMFRERRRQLPSLQFRGLVHLAGLMRLDRSLLEQYGGDVLARLATTYEAAVRQAHMPSVEDLAWALSALHAIGPEGRPLLLSCRQALMKRQLADGGWGSLQAAASSAVATAAAVWALSDVSDGDAGDALERGVRYLVLQVAGHESWNLLHERFGAHVQAFVLRALGAAGWHGEQLLQDRIDQLRDKQNADGGWGTGSGESSNTEVTALVLLALIATGETRVVTSRLARHALADAKQLLRDVEDDRDTLRRDFDQRVVEHCGQIAADREHLLSDNKILKTQLEEAVRTLRAMRRAAKPNGDDQSATSRSSSSLSSRIAGRWGIAAVLVAVGVVALVEGVVIGRLMTGSSGASWLDGLVIGMTILLAASGWMVAGLRRLLRRASGRGMGLDRTEIAVLVRRFHDIASNLPPDVRGDVTRRLVRDLPDLPPRRIGETYVDEMARRLRLSGSRSFGELETWLNDLMSIVDDERRMVLLQLGRSILSGMRWR